MLLTRCTLPLEVVLWRIFDFVVAAIVDVLETFVLDKELESLDVGERFACAEHEVKVRPRNVKLRKPGVFVVLVECFEVDFELLVAEQIQWLFVKAAVFETVDRKYVREFGRGLQSHVNVVAEEEFLSDRNDVTSGAVVCCRDSLLRNQFGRNRTEHVAPLVVELLQTGIQFG